MPRLLWVLLAAFATVSLPAASPPAAELLPSDTLALFSIPDWDKAAAYLKTSPQGKLWQDPALRPFRERLAQRWTDKYAAPLEKELGVKLADYADLFHGEITLAFTHNGWGSAPGAMPGVLLLIDTKDKQELLKTRLAELKRKWVEAGKQLKTDKVRDVELVTLIVSEGELSKTLKKTLPGPDDDKENAELQESEARPAARTEITLGQSGALFIIGNTTKDLERILARQSGSIAPSLSDQAGYEAAQGLFRDALGFAWVNFTRIYATLEKQLTASGRSFQPGNPMAPRTDRLLAATGLSGLKTIAAKISGTGEGATAEVLLSIPQSRAPGLLGLLTTPRKDAGPPAFVGADVIKFLRWRVDGQKAWSTLEKLLASVSPEISGLVQMGLEAAGKDKDPNFDLRKALVGSLGDDFISLHKPPRSSSLAQLNDLPSMFLIGSPAPEQLLQGLKAATALMPLAGGEPSVNEREFLGRKIYSLALAPLDGPDDPKGASASRTFNFATGGGYAALSGDSGLIEEYLRSNERSANTLRDLPGLLEAAQKVGGMGAGLFGYQNQAETIRLWLESSKKENAALDKLLAMSPLAGGKATNAEERKNLTDWLGLSLLPPFEQISKYFHFLVYSLSSSEAGVSWKLYLPAPPRLK